MADGAFPENLGIGDDRANDGGAQLARGVFYFGQFGHTLFFFQFLLHFVQLLAHVGVTIPSLGVSNITCSRRVQFVLAFV